MLRSIKLGLVAIERGGGGAAVPGRCWKLAHARDDEVDGGTANGGKFDRAVDDDDAVK